MTPSEVRDLARRFGIKPTRSLGQNFMVDPNAVRRVIRLAGPAPSDSILEVGAGLGTLTVGLANVAERVVAIEIDRRLTPALEEVTSRLPNVRVVEADAMELDFSLLTEGQPHRMISNLPYNIATPLMAKLLDENPEIYDFAIVVQLEAGERFVAPPGSRTYGSISVMAAYHCSARIAGRIPPTVFWPQPQVESVLVRLTRRPPTVEVEPEPLRKVVRAAFSQRRKTIRNSLSAALGIPVPDVEEFVREAGLDPRARAEMLSLEDFAALTRYLPALDAAAEAPGDGGEDSAEPA